MDRRRKIIAAVLGITLAAIGTSAQTMAPSRNSIAGGSPGLPQNSFQNQTMGSVPAGTASPQPIPLPLPDAIQRGLRQNPGALLSEDAQLSAQGQFTQARSQLLPDFSARISENAQ